MPAAASVAKSRMTPNESGYRDRLPNSARKSAIAKFDVRGSLIRAMVLRVICPSSIEASVELDVDSDIGICANRGIESPPHRPKTR